MQYRRLVPMLQYIFALTLGTDGFPGGALWRSDANGRADSWRDASQAISAALPAANASAAAGIIDVLWHEKKPDRLLFQGKVGAGSMHHEQQ